MNARRLFVALGLLASLAGCAVAPPQKSADRVEPPVASASPPPPPADDVLFVQPDGEAPMADGDEAVAPVARRPGVWTRMRRGFVFAQCDANDESRRWQRTYTRGAKNFTAILAKSMPFLLLVLDEAERRRVPTEFVLLPIVESHYTPFATTGNRPAGMWQIMPATARGRGLAIGATYDGRLDVYASTQVALDLITDLGKRFGDWRLVNMAFNAGEYRVERALAEAKKRKRRPQPRDLAVSPITHEHLAKLNALACIVMQPKRFGITLPKPTPADRLARVVLDDTVDLARVAQAAGVDLPTLKRLNPAFRGTYATRGRSILIPRASHDAFVAAIEDVGAAPAAAVARDAAATNAADAPTGNARYIVQSGDSLWTIAKKFRVSVGSLQAWNRLSNKATLRIGQVLRIAAP